MPPSDACSNKGTSSVALKSSSCSAAGTSNNENSNTETSELKHRELIYALVSETDKVKIVNQMDELIFLYKLRNEQLENTVAILEEKKLVPEVANLQFQSVLPPSTTLLLQQTLKKERPHKP